MLNITTTEVFTSVARACGYPQGFPLRIRGYWLTCFSRSHEILSPHPNTLKAGATPSSPDPYLCALTLVDEEDTGEGVREAAAVSGKEAASLVHVGAELEHLLLCGKGRAAAGGQVLPRRPPPPLG